jgi:hypothetical protein
LAYSSFRILQVRQQNTIRTTISERKADELDSPYRIKGSMILLRGGKRPAGLRETAVPAARREERNPDPSVYGRWTKPIAVKPKIWG